MQIGIKQGMRLMEQSLRELVQQGVVKPEEAALHAENAAEFTKGLAKAQANGDRGEGEGEEDEDG